MAVNEFEEFRKQYEKTFVRIKFEGAKDFTVVVVRACVADDETKPYLVLHNPDLGQCIVNWGETKQSFSYDFPQVGLFNHNRSFLMFHRFPDRQWKRGISSGNSHIADPLRDVKVQIPELRGLVQNGVNIDYHVLSSAFKNWYPVKLNDAMETLSKTDQLGVALNTVFGVTKNPVTASPWVLWKHLSMIGLVHHKTRTIEVRESVFQQEVSDFLKRQQEHTWTLR